MGKPRMIILIRHAQSEGNKNREIHQTIPDHRVKLTPEGWAQASEAGRKLRSLLRPDDTLHFFTSPYRRTRETTEGILESLTSSNPAPSPFPRHAIKVYEEPRLREQDFGNFQPSSAEMARMWQERAEYGHFFYRIPNGESAADAYDRVSGFNESLWRGFGEDSFASVCVLVTHGLMTRVFLMKWYHFSVEYFEDLRNVNHCEFVVMKLNPDNGKYVLQNQLRTWSELRRERKNSRVLEPESPIPVRKKWEGCQDGGSGGVGENGDVGLWKRSRQRRQNTADLFMDEQLEGREYEALRRKESLSPRIDPMTRANKDSEHRTNNPTKVPTNSPTAAQTTNSRTVPNQENTSSKPPSLQNMHQPGRDGGGSFSGITSPGASGSEHEQSEDAEAVAKEKETMHRKPPQSSSSLQPGRKSMALALNGELSRAHDDDENDHDHDPPLDRARADALGDQSEVEDGEDEDGDDRFLGNPQSVVTIESNLQRAAAEGSVDVDR